jgi:hypothetical protein
MFRNITTLVLASAALIVPANVFATGNNPPSHTSVHVTTTSAIKGGLQPTNKIATTVKTDLHVTAGTNHVVGTLKTFPTLNKSAGPKVSDIVVKNLTKKTFDPQYNLKFGTKFDKGFYYKGKNHNHWSYRCWYPEFGCYCYWDPCVCTYYYFCEPDCCFYPIAYCPYQVYYWPGVFVVETIPVVSCDCAVPQ